MSLHVYDVMNCIEEPERAERVEMVVDICESADAAGGHDSNTGREKTKLKKSSQLQQTESHPAKNRCYRLTTVCLVLLCVLLLAAMRVLWLKLFGEKDQLQTSYNNSTSERDQLHTSYNSLIKEKKELQESYNKLLKERDQLQSSYNSLIKEKDQLQAINNNLIKERDQLQSSYNSLIKEKDQLQAINNNLIKERDQLQSSYNNPERDQLQSKYNKLIKEKEELQSIYNSLTSEREQLRKERDGLQRRISEFDIMIQQGWRFHSFRLYYISSDRKSWIESREECRGRGADMVIINSREEQEYISKHFVSTMSWIGLTDGDTDGVWKWVDGTELNSGYWRGGESKGDGDCVITGSGNDKTNNWQSVSCDTRHMWICEKDFTLQGNHRKQK